MSDMQIVACRIESTCFALPIHSVQEIIRERQIKAVPGKSPTLIGLAQLRGNP